MARSVVVTLSANVGSYIAAMGQAAAATSAMASSAQAAAGRIGRVAQQNSAEWNQVAGSLTRVGAVAAAGLGLAAKAAIDWESAFAGVRKTVDGSPQQIAALEGELRQMARTMATSHRDIAATAEAAGQLGVATEDVASFTRTMIMLGETTNMTASDAATSLAQFMAVMGTAPDQVGNLGAALVGLGNNSATTESQILQMGQRIAGAGKAIGLSEDEVLGFAAAIASTGIEVEAGGTAISNSMFKMEQAVRAGGAELDILAQTAGMSSAEFKRAFEEDAAGAVLAFVEGLGRVQAAGGDVTGILRDLGITGIREADTLRRLANAGTLLGDSLAQAGQDMAAGTALMDEYAQRAATTESQVRIAWNNIKDAAITAGGAMLPAIAAGAQAFASLAQAAGSMPAPLRNALLALTATVAAVGLFGGAAMRAVAGIVALRAAASTLFAALAGGGASAALAAGQMRNYGLQAAAAGVGLLALYNISSGLSREIEKNSASVEAYAAALGRLGAEGSTGISSLDREVARFGQTSAMLGQGVKDTASLFDALAESSGALGSAFKFLGDTLGLGSTLGNLRDEVGKLDQALTQMEPQKAAAAFRELSEQMTRSGIDMDDQLNLFDDYRSKIDQLADSLGVSLTPLETYQAMLGQMPPALADAIAGNADAAAAFEQIAGAAGQAAMSIQDYANAMLALSGSQIGVEAAIAAANDALKENGRNIDITTEKGRQNVSALNQMAAASMQYVQTMADQGRSQEEQAAAIARARGEYERLAQAMGFSADDARRMADAYFETVAPSQQAADAARRFAVDAAAGSTAAGAMGDALRNIPPTTEVTVTADSMEPVTIAAGNLHEELQRIPADKVITVTMPNGEVVTGTAAEIQAGLERIQNEKNIAFNTPGAMEAQAAAQQLQAMLTGLPEYKSIQVTMPNGEQTYTTAQRLGEVIRGVPDDKTITLTLSNGETVTVTAGQARAAIESIPALKNTTINADASGAVSGARQAQGAIDATRGVTRDIAVDPSRAISGSASAQGSINRTFGVTRQITVTSNAAAAAGAAQASMNSVRNVSRTIYITTVQRTVGVTSRDTFGGVTRADGGIIPAYSGLVPAAFAGARQYAGGGTIAGWSPHPKADNVPIMATAGEFMQPVAAVQRYGLGVMEAIRSGLVDPEELRRLVRGYAGGGEIRAAFSRLTAHPHTAATGATRAGTVINRTVNQTNNVYYPVAERESTRVRRGASETTMAAML